MSNQQDRRIAQPLAALRVAHTTGGMQDLEQRREQTSKEVRLE